MPRVGNGNDFDECWRYPVDNKVVGMNNEFARTGDASRTIEVGTARKIGYRAVNRAVKITRCRFVSLRDIVENRSKVG